MLHIPWVPSLPPTPCRGQGVVPPSLVMEEDVATPRGAPGAPEPGDKRTPTNSASGPCYILPFPQRRRSCCRAYKGNWKERWHLVSLRPACWFWLLGKEAALPFLSLFSSLGQGQLTERTLNSHPGQGRRLKIFQELSQKAQNRLTVAFPDSLRLWQKMNTSQILLLTKI